MTPHIHPSMAAIGTPLEHLVIRHAGDTFRRIMGGPAVKHDRRFIRLATAEPLRIAHRLDYRVGVLQASDEGHPVYRRIGFVDVGAVPLYLRMPA